MLFTLVTPLMALIATVQANVVTIVEDITETVTVTNCGTKSCHPASQVNITSGGQTVVRCPIGEILTGIYPPPTETPAASERTHAPSYTHQHSHSSLLVSPVSSASSPLSVSSPPSAHAETIAASHSAESSKMHSFSQIASSMPSVSSPPCSPTTTRIASYPASFASDATNASTVILVTSVPASSASPVPPKYNTTAETCIVSHFSDVPCSEKTRLASTRTLCAGCSSTQESSVSGTTTIASTVNGTGSYTTIYSSEIKSTSISVQCTKCTTEASSVSSDAPQTTLSAEVSSVFTSISYNATSVIASNASQIASCTTCSVPSSSSSRVSFISSFSQGIVSSESNQEATAYVDVTATRYLNSSSGNFYTATPKASSGVATKLLPPSIYSDRSNSSISTLASVTPYQGGASSMKAAGFGAVLGAALVAIM